jgi:hypothetical protein
MNREENSRENESANEAKTRPPHYFPIIVEKPLPLAALNVLFTSITFDTIN